MMVSLILVAFVFVMFSPSATVAALVAAISQAIPASFPAPCKPQGLHLNGDVEFSVLLLHN